MEGAEMREVSVVFKPWDREAAVPQGMTVMEAALKAALKLPSECGGQGSCGRCRVLVSPASAVKPPSSSEIRLLTKEEMEMGYRLACQAILEDDAVVDVPRESRTGKRKFQTNGLERTYHFEPSVRKLHLGFESIAGEGSITEEEILEAAAGKAFDDLRFSSRALEDLPGLIIGSSATLTIADGMITSVEAGDTSNRLYGIAVDIGTSKIVGHLVYLHDGRTVAVASVENPQAIHGEDVISRIAFASKAPENLEELHRLSVEAVNEVIQSSCSDAGVEPREIYEVVAVGNTLMHHLFMGVDAEPLGRAPFEPVVKDSVRMMASELRVSSSPGGMLYFPPLIAGFVGSDAVAGLVATGMFDSEEPVLMVDIGTNTEVFVGDRSGLASCSCASGPAFEGGHIRHGVKAVTGAIERLRIDPDTLEVEYDTIGGAEPIGICGSAMIDALAELWKSGFVDGFGHLTSEAKTPRIRVANGRREFVVEWAEATGTGNDIALSEGDIEELLLAKAAIYSACSVMLERRGLETNELSKIYVAGAFGESIDPMNVVVMGMLPEIEPGKIVFAGNTAITGAKAILVSKAARDIAERLPEEVHYHELSLDPEFNKEFIAAMFLPHREPERFPTAQKFSRDRSG
jgi:uncharacterized 2Fe-2S/4Fe-4S cluster protein (DUF4445 family)